MLLYSGFGKPERTRVSGIEYLHSFLAVKAEPLEYMKSGFESPFLENDARSPAHITRGSRQTGLISHAGEKFFSLR